MEKNVSKNLINISKDSAKRLISDVKEIIKNPLHSEGIYYKHDDENMLKGYALIIGPKETLYFGGNFFFEFDFPYDYPYRPPIVTYKTNDGVTRFHPNLYKNGKVCLSILNTWKGEQWTGCQSIRSVLLTIVSILDKYPLLHEPGITERHRDFENYNKIILYKNFEIAILDILSKKSTSCPDIFKKLFQDEINENFKKNKDLLEEQLTRFSNLSRASENVKTSLYVMNINIDWNKLSKTFKQIKT